MVVSMSVVYPRDRAADWELQLTVLLSVMREYVPSTTKLGKGKHAEFKVWLLPDVYYFCTMVKLKNYRLNHPKSGPS